MIVFLELEFSELTLAWRISVTRKIRKCFEEKVYRHLQLTNWEYMSQSCNVTVSKALAVPATGGAL